MMKRSGLIAAALTGMVAAGSVYAIDGFQVTGYGATPQLARAAAGSEGRALCVSAGYQRSSYEEMTNNISASGWVSFGYVTCF